MLSGRRKDDPVMLSTRRPRQLITPLARKVPLSLACNPFPK